MLSAPMTLDEEASDGKTESRLDTCKENLLFVRLVKTVYFENERII